jgi:hypothetical protein
VALLSSPPLLWRYGCCHGRMTEVMSSQGVVLVLMLTVHVHVHTIDGSECRSWEPPWLPVLPEGSTCPSGEAETHHEGSGTFDDAVRAQARWRDVARDAYRAQGLYKAWVR